MYNCTAVKFSASLRIFGPSVMEWRLWLRDVGEVLSRLEYRDG